jgi:hypothetical protein
MPIGNAKQAAFQPPVAMSDSLFGDHDRMILTFAGENLQRNGLSQHISVTERNSSGGRTRFVQPNYEDALVGFFQNAFLFVNPPPTPVGP